MEIRVLTSQENFRHYDVWMRRHPQGSLWQSLDWKLYQERLGRETRIYGAMEGPQIVASALVVIDHTASGLSTWEIPRGPIAAMSDEPIAMSMLEKVAQDATKDGCITLFFSPFSPLPTQSSKLKAQSSTRHVMPQATRMFDLTLSDDDLLTGMTPKGRYNIRLAQRHGVIVQQSQEIDLFSALAQQTSQRDGFRPPRALTYQRFLESLPTSFLLLAYAPVKHEKKPLEGASHDTKGNHSFQLLAGLLGLIWGNAGIYYYGASSSAHRELMAPYLLQWEAMRYCRAHGCTAYDLFGIAPEGALNHPWAGVSAFKAKFGGQVVTYPPEQEIVLRPMMKTLLGLKRKILG